jgi:anaerobic magnesium-protoporphyrin IX monomethyl ester cyclase
MNILLIQPEKVPGIHNDIRGFIPLPLLYLAAAVRDHGHSPHLLDFSVLDIPESKKSRTTFLKNTCNTKIKEFGIKLVGINCFTSMHFSLVEELAEIIKRHNPDVKICIGGSHPTFFGEDILANNKCIDYIVAGEGEEALIRLAKIVENGHDMLTQETEISNIPALIYRNNNGEILNNLRKSYLKEINTLKMPAWDLIDLTDYSSNHHTYYNPKKLKFHLTVPIMSSRSCPFSCTFCSAHLIMGNSYRKKTAVQLVDEIEYLHVERNQNYFSFMDDAINIEKKHVIDICNEIGKRNLNIQFSVEQGLYMAKVDKELVDTLADAGMVTLYLPIEHGDEKIRTSILRKKLTDEKIYEVLGYAKDRDLFTVGLFLMGIPEETEETLEQTRKFIIDLSLDINIVSRLVPFPKTAIADQAKRDGLLLINTDDVWNGNEFFSPKNRGQFFIKPYNASLEILHKYREIFNSMHYFSERAKKLNNIESV